jgi:KUP system potassium uptake protein
VLHAPHDLEARPDAHVPPPVGAGHPAQALHRKPLGASAGARERYGDLHDEPARIRAACLLHNLKHNKVLHEQTVFLTIITHDVPMVPREDRVQLERLVEGFYKLEAWYGFKEQPDIDEILNTCRVRYGLAFDVMDTSFFLSRETVIPADDALGMMLWRDHLFAWMTRNATRATDFFNIPPNRVVELGTHVEI